MSEAAVWVVVSPTASLASRRRAPASGHLLRIDPATNQVAAVIPLNASHPERLALSAEAPWVLAADVTPGAPADPRLLQIDFHTNQISATIYPDFFPMDVAYGADALWLTTDDSSAGKILARLEPRPPYRIDKIGLDDVSDRVAIDDNGSIWVTGKYAAGVYCYNPTVSTVKWVAKLEGFSGALLAGAGAIWAVCGTGEEAGVARIDPVTRQVTALTRLEHAWKMAVTS